MTVPEFIQKAVEAKFKPTGPDDPLEVLWVFDPVHAEVHISNDHKKEDRHKGYHDELAEKVNHHPSRVHGYAMRLSNGWRIVDWDYKEVDPFIRQKVVETLNDTNK